MKKIIKELEKIIIDFSGKVVCIGTMDEYLLGKINNNKNIKYCDLLNCFEKKGGNTKKQKEKNLMMKDFRKFYGKKKIDYMLCNISDIKGHIPRFIPDSIYINKKIVYIYGKNDIYDYQRIIKKYNRYKASIEYDNIGEYFLLRIDVSNCNNKIICDKLFYISDSLEKFSDKISDLIVS